MNWDKRLKASLADTNYTWQKRLMIEGTRSAVQVYRALWSTSDVEHFLYFSEDRRGNLIANFGLKNPSAQEFGIASLLKYGRPSFREAMKGWDHDAQCAMSYSCTLIGKTPFARWPQIYVPSLPGEQLGRAVKNLIRRELIPLVGHITDLKSYLAVLQSNDVIPWYAVSVPIRAAQICAISFHFSIDARVVREIIKPYELKLAVDLGETTLDAKTCADRYLAHVARDLMQTPLKKG